MGEYIPASKDFSPQSPDSVVGLAGNTGSKSDFGRVEGNSPLCLQAKEKCQEDRQKGKLKKKTPKIELCKALQNFSTFYDITVFTLRTVCCHLKW